MQYASEMEADQLGSFDQCYEALEKCRGDYLEAKRILLNVV